ncbi:aspartate aminotransferase [Aeropyrum pernix K1]|uniref:Aminotransferase n=1 Tax=Aeropyrum pernix (strain ATCC 700893 / DSM 11879 / JCM 9820 / NBRC 100138 / K1) TaxID=272557 RepID=Q9Y9P0_AERPE|nr:pyridoxal phosphate-dependent aminotransferase [Aeropyrum pernix]BAA81260.2 aspartate aminotransferase [Aeropyrum pernix K1]
MPQKDPTLDIQERVVEIEGETAFAYLAVARKLIQEGRRVISFGIGQPDFPTPHHIREAAKKALDEGFTGYTETAGIPELREAIAWYLNSRYGADVSPEEVIATTGAKTAIFLGMALYLRPGDEVIIPDPSYYAYAQVAKLFGARPVYVPMKFEPGLGFRFDIEGIERAVSEKTRMIVVNNPHNPTGSVFPPDQVEAIHDIARRRGLIILADEIYDNFLYTEKPFKSTLSLPDWRENLVYVNGFSKTFSMTGWRLGYVVLRREVIPKALDLAVTIYSCPPSIAQKAGVAALRGDWGPVREMVEEFRSRARILYDILSQAEGIEPYLPEGAFYMFPRVAGLLRKTGLSVEQLAEKLLYSYGVLVLPGTSFPESVGREHVRLSFATATSDVKEGAEIIVRASRELSSG